MLQGLFLDLDNTLIDRDGAFRALLLETFADPQVRRNLEQLDGGGHGDRQRLFQAWHRFTGQPLDQRELAERLAAHIRPDPELLQVLQALSGRLKVAIISNGGGPGQRLKMAAAGLDQPIEAVYLSGEVGLEKPDPRIFWRVARELNVPPARCLVLGDQEGVDGLGARSAGMAFGLTEGVLTGPKLRLWTASVW
jgi:putative hydrolase of the HAD superfamily